MTGKPEPQLPAGQAGCVVGEQWMDRLVVVSATGVVDMLSAPQLEQAIDAVLPQGPEALIVDLTAVDFLASAGMGVIVAAHDKASPEIKFAVVADGSATSRPLKLVGIADIVGMYPTLEQARAGLRD